MKVLLPDTMPLDFTIPDGSSLLPQGWETITYNAREVIPETLHDADALVVWGNSRKNLESAARQLTQVQLVQSLAAGVDGIIAAGFPSEVPICTGAGLHCPTVAEHTLALLLALVRRIPESLQSQARHEWSRELGGLQPLHPEGRLTTLLGARILIWGFGEIGQHLAPMLKMLGADVTGIARTAGKREGFPVICEDALADYLPSTDVLISILPATPRTEQILGADTFARLPKHALVINVGRGATLDENALLEALRAQRIGGAALDVTAVEPLPEESPLWDAPGLIVTPHGAGGRPVGAPERIVANLRALASGKQLIHPVDRSAMQ
ncbi:phosphoglycerate dehydrogenase [Devriesea agamarum]|uniref:phosphoglycerate dehydrogenase n=1 Tax=Devriesea agamarum TaxID=472569 RepID=UPI00071CAE4C|nr:phosphoglycerate dehydrogenase [Devriesea agamarum]